MIFFVHIGKTAGSTLNRYLAQAIGPGHAHCEAFIHDDALWSQRVQSVKWLSGHIPLPTARSRLDGCGREVRYFTCIRDPKSQVMSHYNWLAEIFYRGPAFYNAHPEYIRKISERVQETLRNPTPARIVQDLDEFHGLFLNHQSRYFLGNDLGNFVPRLERSLGSFSGICTPASLPNLVALMAGRTVEIEETVDNASRYHFDKQLFDADEVEDFLISRNAKDIHMHKRVTNHMKDGVLLREHEPGGAA